MEYAQDSDQTFYVTFADLFGQDASVSSGTISISHRTSAGNVTDLSERVMSSYSGASQFYHSWHIPAGADRGRYNVRYVGTYADGTIAVGSEEFYVIPRRFYDKKSGGLTKHSIMVPIWTKEEKNRVLDIIERIEGKSDKSDLKVISDTLNGLSSILVEMSLELNKGNTFSESALSNFSELLIGQSKKIDGYKSTIASFAESEKKINFDDSNIISKLSMLTKQVNDFGIDLRNERINLIISELEDLRRGVDEFKKIFVSSLPMEIIERELNAGT